MRKTLEIAALCLVLFIWAVTANAVLGPSPLPANIPTHFNSVGQPDGWGTPGMLWLIPLVGTVIYLLMMLVARYPFDFSMRTTPAGRRRLEAIALSMILWLKAEVLCLFAWIQYGTIGIIRRGQGRLSPVWVALLLVAVFGTIGWHLAAMRRVARAQ
jgi:uncharacterized membrane protein